MKSNKLTRYEIVAKLKFWFGERDAEKIFNTKKYKIQVEDNGFIYVYEKV